MTFYGSEISGKNENRFTRIPTFCRKIITILFAHILIFIEELYFIYDFFKRSEKVQDLARAGKFFKDLSDSERDEVESYYTAKMRRLDRAQKVICRESSIQLVLQNSLIVYQGKF